MAISSCANLSSNSSINDDLSSPESSLLTDVRDDANPISPSSQLDSSKPSEISNSNDQVVAFNDYTNLMKIEYRNELLKAEDKDSGLSFSNFNDFNEYYTFITDGVHNAYTASDLFNHLDSTYFDNYNLYVTAQVTLPDSSFDFEFNSMLTVYGNLRVVIDRTRTSGAAYQFLRWGVYAFFIDKNIVFDKVTTIINKTDGFDNV